MSAHACEIALPNLFDGLIMSVEIQKVEFSVEKIGQLLEVVLAWAMQLATFGPSQEFQAV